MKWYHWTALVVSMLVTNKLIQIMWVAEGNAQKAWTALILAIAVTVGVMIGANE